MASRPRRTDPRMGSHRASFVSGCAWARAGRQVRVFLRRGSLTVLAAVLSAASPAAADDVGGGEAVDISVTPAQAPPEDRFPVSELSAKAMDAVLLRPLGAIASIAGLAMFMVSAPLVAPSGELPATWDIFVFGPVDYTFMRPLGDF